MTKNETIQILQSIEDRAIEFPNMTECDWVAIAAAKRHLTNDIETKEVDLEKEMDAYWDKYCNDEFGELVERSNESFDNIAKHFFELGLKTKGE